MKLKICGLKNLNDVDCVNQANVDYVGFIFAPSKRQITSEAARVLKAALNPNIKVVGVFIDESYEFIKYLIDEEIIDMAQFHGDIEYPVSCPSIRAMKICGKEDIKPTNCDYVLFDSPKIGAQNSSGGTFDWQLIEDYNEKPFFLAGGIDITNIRQAMELNPHCIDISSGAENENGDKSLAKIMELRSMTNK